MRFHHLDTLRFFFAATIVFGHAIGWMWIARNGGLAVDFFFILSGFVLTHLLFRQRLPFPRFFVARFARMWPLNIVTMTAMCLILASQGFPPAPSVVAVNALLLQNSGIIDALTLNWPSWSISAEMIVGLLVLYPIATRRLPVAAMAAVVISLVILLQQPGEFEQMHFQPFGFVSIGLVRCVFGTSLGYLAYEAYARYQPNRMPSPVAAVLHIAILCLFVWLMTWPLNNVEKAAGVFACAIAIFFLAAEKSIVTEFLAHPQVSWLGSISFGIYMVHAPILTAFRAWALLPADGFFASAAQHGEMAAALWHYAIGLGAFFAAVMLIAFGAYHLLEMPAKAALLAVFGGRKAAARSAAAAKATVG